MTKKELEQLTSAEHILLSSDFKAEADMINSLVKKYDQGIHKLTHNFWNEDLAHYHFRGLIKKNWLYKVTWAKDDHDEYEMTLWVLSLEHEDEWDDDDDIFTYESHTEMEEDVEELIRLGYHVQKSFKPLI